MSRTNATAALRISSVGRAFLTKTCWSGSTLKLLFGLQRLREFHAVLVRRELQPRLCLLERDVRIEARSRLEEVALVDGIGIELKWDPQLGLLTKLRDVELRTDHADHDVRITAQRECLADDGRVGREAPRPQPWLSTATFSPPGRSSSGVNVRPMMSRAPNRRK